MSLMLQMEHSGCCFARGMMFDVCAIEDVEIISFDVNCYSWKTDIVNVYVTKSIESYTGIKNSPSEWEHIYSKQLTGIGSNKYLYLGPFNLNTSPIEILKGECAGFYFYSANISMLYGSGTAVGNVYASNLDILVKEGHVMNRPFGGPEYFPIRPNGQIYYRQLTSNPTTSNPTTFNPTTSNPTTFNPTTLNPTTLSPTTLNPTTFNPTTSNPTTFNPTTLNPTTLKYMDNVIILPTESTKTASQNTHHVGIFNMLVAIIITVSCFIIAFISYIMIKRRRTASNKRFTYINNTLYDSYISNALVVIISIGNYEYMEPIDNPDITDGFLTDLPLDKDIENLQELFGKTLLNYKIIPEESKLTWTEIEIINFLTHDVGNELFDENNELKYDGLIVCISCHGIKNHIITSDFRQIEKIAIHRIISIPHPTVREIPRLFIFDSCDGAKQREFIRTSTVNIDEYKNFNVGKMVRVEQFETGMEWTTATKNPDFRLMEIHAANSGYQAKLDIRFGSYLIHSFTQQMKANVENKEGKTLGNIFDTIQNELHDKGKQQTTNVFNNNTRDLQLKINR